MRVLLAEHHRYDSVVRVGSHHVARVLIERGHELVWLAHPRTGLHRAWGPPPPVVRRHPDGVTEITLRAVLPYVRLPLLDSVVWGRRWLRAAPGAGARLRGLVGGACDLFWISDFTCLGLLDKLVCRRVVFRFFDRLEGFRWMPRSIYRLALRYRDRADAILASSRAIERDLARVGLEAEYLPNGAHLREGSRALATRGEREDLVVYVGAVRTWFDLPTIVRWARALPATRFEVVGPVSRRIGSVPSNLRFAGPLPYDELPALLSRAKVGIIPFVRSHLTEGVHPLKLYEYLAAGTPVVSVDLPEVEPVPGAVYVYSTPDEGLAHLRACLAGGVERSALHDLAAANTWELRLAGVFARLDVPGL